MAIRLLSTPAALQLHAEVGLVEGKAVRKVEVGVQELKRFADHQPGRMKALKVVVVTLRAVDMDYSTHASVVASVAVDAHLA